MKLDSCLYHTRVHHLRFRPQRHEFRYRSTSFLFDLDELDELDRYHRIFSLNRPNLVSFHEKDYGDGSATPLKQQVKNKLGQAGCTDSIAKILLLTQPRVWGYVFNPLSVYYCLDRDENIRAVIYEVNNTFGDRHSYVFLAHPESGAREHGCRKLLHVSPFFDMTGSYRFRNILPGEKLNLGIRYLDDGGNLQFYAALRGKRRTLDNGALLGIAFARPPAGVKVIGAIHWQGLKLWLKKLKLFRRPRVPKKHHSSSVMNAPKRSLEYGHEQ